MELKKNNILFSIAFLALTIFSANNCFAQSIDSAEYFYDVDPGVGNGFSIALTPADTIEDTIATSTIGLSAGFHNIYIRVKDTNNLWSLYEGGRFYLTDTLSTTQTLGSLPIYAAEYFYDTDPGVGNGIPVSAFTAADSITHTDTISTTILATGKHSVYVRVRDSLNIWSLYEGASFNICNLIPKADFSADTVCLYSKTTFTDLSIGIDTNFNYTYGWNFNNDLIIDDTTKGNTSFLFSTSGTHTVSLIVNNTNGCSDTVIKIVYVDSLPTVTFILPVDTICKDDTLTLSGGSPAGGTYSGPGVYNGLFYADSVNAGMQNLVYTYYNTDSCTAFANSILYVSPCTGINELNGLNFTVQIAPNPFKTKTELTLKVVLSSNNSYLLSLFDMYGKEVRTQKINAQNTSIERNELPAGLYFYKVFNLAGEFVSGKVLAID